MIDTGRDLILIKLGGKDVPKSYQWKSAIDFRLKRSVQEWQTVRKSEGRKISGSHAVDKHTYVSRIEVKPLEPTFCQS